MRYKKTEEFSLPRAEYFLYDIKCSKGYRYIGVTSNIQKRLTKHKNKEGSRVTKKFKPEKLVRCYRLGVMEYEEAEMYEDRYTLEKMKNNPKKVRGGHYCKINMKFKPAQIEENIEKIPEKYSIQNAKRIKIDFNFCKKRYYKKTKKYKNPWKKQEAMAKKELEENAKRFL